MLVFAVSAVRPAAPQTRPGRRGGVSTGLASAARPAAPGGRAGRRTEERWGPVVDEGQQHPEQQHPAEHARRLYARSTRVEDGLPCVLLVIEGDDSWSITGQGQDLPARGVRVPNDVMYLLAKSIVARGRQVGDTGD